MGLFDCSGAVSNITTSTCIGNFHIADSPVIHQAQHTMAFMLVFVTAITIIYLRMIKKERDAQEKEKEQQ